MQCFYYGEQSHKRHAIQRKALRSSHSFVSFQILRNFLYCVFFSRISQLYWASLFICFSLHFGFIRCAYSNCVSHRVLYSVHHCWIPFAWCWCWCWCWCLCCTCKKMKNIFVRTTCIRWNTLQKCRVSILKKTKKKINSFYCSRTNTNQPAMHRHIHMWHRLVFPH